MGHCNAGFVPEPVCEKTEGWALALASCLWCALNTARLFRSGTEGDFGRRKGPGTVELQAELAASSVGETGEA